MHRTAWKRSLPLLAALVTTTAALAAPPAAQVRAEVRAAASLAAGRLERVPSEGDRTHEVQFLGAVGAQGLGEIMGWGGDRFENVSPQVVETILVHFGRGIRQLEALNEEITYPAMLQMRDRLGASIGTIREAVENEARTTQEVRELARLCKHHAGEIVGSPLTPNSFVAKRLVVRTLDVGFTALKADLEELPELSEPTAEAMATLAVLRDVPAPCMAEPAPTDACLRDVTEAIGDAFSSIEQAATATPTSD